MDGFCLLTIQYHSSLIIICMQNLKKFREQILKLSIGNGADGQTDGRTYGRTDIGRYKKGSNCVNTVDRVKVLTLCNFADGPLSMYQVSFNSLLYFQRYAPENKWQKLKREVTP